MSISNNIITPAEAVQKQGAKVIIYGMSGAGKTYSIKTCPGRVLVISAEAGLLSIRDATNVSVIEVNTAEGVHNVYNELLKGDLKGQFDTVCLDSLSEISELLLIAEKAKQKEATIIYGYEMLLGQAIRAFEIWHGIEAPYNAMKKALLGGV